ncbi:MAG: DUF4159 domain-containing protein [Rhodobacteraceae bacterium]|nr:DUF4159 domain-containing protein [Paracoccaceae bacterium]
MLVLGPIGFATPWLLIALAVLPILWLILRAVPPAPVRRLFPGVVLLMGMEDRDSEADRTPWWLLLLRILAIAAMILGFAGPVLNPAPDGDKVANELPLLVFIENGWAAAPDWPARIEAAQKVVNAASRQGQLVALVTSAELQPPHFKAASDVAGHLSGLVPVAWEVALDVIPDWVTSLRKTEVLWISDGVRYDGREALLKAFEVAGPVQVLEPPAKQMALRPVTYKDGLIRLTAMRITARGAETANVLAYGAGPGGVERELARVVLDFADGEGIAEEQLSLPPELRNRVTRFTIEGENSAGAVTLADDSLRRRRVGLVGPGSGREGLELLSPLHYLRTALEPSAELIDGSLEELARAGADVIILADFATLAEPDQLAIAEWVAQGGLLLRFAGPRLAAADTGRGVEDVLLPVRLRAGGRVVGGAMSWGEPRAIAPFNATSPFYGLAIPDEVTVSAQVLAEPGPEMAARTIAALADGTPLVTRKALGDGQVVLFHVTANAEWSGLPLSGLFMQMLERLAVSTRAETPLAVELAGTNWRAENLLDGFGTLGPARAQNAVPGETISDPASAAVPAGIYADEARRIAVNVTNSESLLKPAIWPDRITPIWGGEGKARDLSGWLWLAALAVLAVDILAALALSGRMPRWGARAAGLALVVGLGAGLGAGVPDQALAQSVQDEESLIAAAAEVTLAFVITGDREVDRISAAGLLGLSDELFRRTSVEPALPVGIDLETDELSVYPLLYWPVTNSQTLPSDAAYSRLNAYMASGGMVLFDTRDAHISGFGGAATPAARWLRVLAARLVIPPLEPVPEDHVLTRTFYLLTSFPGRHLRGVLWVEAAPADAERAEGMPFRNLNDGASPVFIGGNDWAAAWAVMPNGAYMFPIGRGSSGERQREMAYRFGVNLVMHVLTGNYKSDQVHVPALLERLGQ